jgi:hypothetical protein
VLVPPGQWEQCVLPNIYHHVSTAPRVPFAPLPLRSFIATMDTADSCAAGSSRRMPMNTSFDSAQVSLIHAHNLPDHSVANHPLPSSDRFDTLPLSVTGFRPLPERSGFRHCLAGSSRTAGRITFVILRTDRSPPVAPHARLTATQLRSVTGRRAPAWRGLPPL